MKRRRGKTKAARVRKALRDLGIKSRRDRARLLRTILREKAKAIEAEFGKTPAEARAMAGRISYAPVAAREAHREVRARYVFDVKSKRFRDEVTGRMASKTTVRRSLSMTAYWKQVRFLAKVAELSIADARKAYDELKDVQSIRRVLAGS